MLDDIRAECGRRGLDTTGHRRTLAVRLCEAVGLSWSGEHSGPVGRLDQRHLVAAAPPAAPAPPAAQE